MPIVDRYERASHRYRDAEVLASFMRGVYGWMCGGLAITAATAWLVASSPALTAAIFGNRIMFWVLALAQLGIVFALSARVDQMAASTASRRDVRTPGLYLDFINLFLFLLRFFGNRRDDWR